MWKNVKFKKGALSILLILGLVLSNLRSFDSFASETDSGQNDFKAQLVEVLKPVYADKSGKIATDLSEIVKEDKQKDVLALLQSALKNQAGSAEKAEKEKNEGANAPEDTKESNASNAEDGSKLQESGSTEVEAKQEAVSVIPAPPRPESAPAEQQNKNASKKLGKDVLEKILGFVKEDADVEVITGLLKDLKSDDITDEEVSELIVKAFIANRALNVGKNGKELQWDKKYILDHTVTQTDNQNPEGNLDPNRDFRVTMRVNLPIASDASIRPYLTKNDYIRIPMASGVKITGEVDLGNISAKYKVNEQETEVKNAFHAKVVMDGNTAYMVMTLLVDNTAFVGASDIVAKISMDFSVDLKNIDKDDKGRYIASIDKKLYIGQVNSKFKMDKSAEIDYNKGKIDWEIEIEKIGDVGKQTSLAGYKFEDPIDFKEAHAAGKYVPKTFKIYGADGVELFADNSNDIAKDTSSALKLEPSVLVSERTALTYLFPYNTPGKVTVRFSTDLNENDYAELRRGFKKVNTAYLYEKEGGVYKKELVRSTKELSWNGTWGVKTHGGYAEKNGVRDILIADHLKAKGMTADKFSEGDVGIQEDAANGNYKLQWNVFFDATDKNLKNVKIKDNSFPIKGRYSDAELKLTKWMLRKWDVNSRSWLYFNKSDKTWVTEKKEYQANEAPANGIYEVGNLNTIVKLTIWSEVKGLKGLDRFSNLADVTWDDGYKWVEFGHDKDFGEKLIDKKSATKVVEANPTWKIKVNKKIVDENNRANKKTYVYDTVIDTIVGENKDVHWHVLADEKKKADRDKFSLESGEKVLPSGAKVADLVYRASTHKMSFDDGSFEDELNNKLRHKVYPIYYTDNNGKKTEVGKIIEVTGFEDCKNTIEEKDDNGNTKSEWYEFSFRTNIIDAEKITGGDRNEENTKDLTGKYNQISNLAYLYEVDESVQNQDEKAKRITFADAWPSLNHRMVKKDAVPSEVAEKLMSGELKSYNAEDIGLNNVIEDKSGAYVPKDKSVIFRISLNAASVRIPDNRKLEAVLRDALEGNFKIVDINDKHKFLIYKGTPRTEFKGTDFVSDAFVRAEGDPLNNDDIFSIDKEPGKGWTLFRFKKLEGPYVLFVRAKAIDDVDNQKVINEKSTVYNLARFIVNNVRADGTKEKEFSNVSTKTVEYDARFLSKEYTVDKGGIIRWTIVYDPSIMDPNTKQEIEKADKKEITLYDELEKGLNVFSKDGEPALDSGFYTLHDEDGKDITSSLSSRLTYKKVGDKDTLTLKIPNNERLKKVVFSYDTIQEQGAPAEIRNTVRIKIADEDKSSVETATFRVKAGVQIESYEVGAKMTLKIKKTDADDGKPIEGVEFELVAPDGKKKEILTTDDKGEASLPGLTETVGDKKYTIKEIKADGYQIDKNTYSFNIERLQIGNKITLVMKNFKVEGQLKGEQQLKLEGGKYIAATNKKIKLTCPIKLIKADAADYDKPLDKLTKLDGAEFRLVNKAGSSVAHIATTENGELTFVDVEAGTYILSETKAPTGYAILAKPYEITVTPGAVKSEVAIKGADTDKIKQIDNTIVVFNEKLMDLDLYKADLADKDKSLNQMLVLGGAKFKLTSVSDAAVTHEATTATDGAIKGKLTFKNLKAGTYILKETEAPTGYAILAKPYEITVTPGAVKSEVAIKGADSDQIKLIDNTVVVFNEKIYDLKIVKADLVDQPKTEVAGATLSAIAKLNGAKFNLALASDETVSQAAVLESGEYTFKGLKKGKYKLIEENAPQNYNSLINSIEVDIDPNAAKSKEVIVSGDNAKFFDNAVVVFNERQKESIELNLIKADMAGINETEENKLIKLQGAKFTLVYKDDQTVSSSAVMPADGKVRFAVSKAGIYTLTEEIPPTGYAILAKSFEIAVTPGAVTGRQVYIKDTKPGAIKMLDKKTNTIVVFNEKLYDLNLLKADLDVNAEIVTKSGVNVTLGAIKTPLSGARFRLALASDSAVSYSAVTGENGSAKFTGLKSGTYVLTEEAAPSGYNRVTTGYAIVVTASAVKPELEIKEPKAGEIRELDGTVVVFNKKTPYVPYPTPGPSPSPDPSPNPNPNPPTPTTDLPRYPENNFPDPNDPGSPDEFVAVDDDGTPQGKYVKSKKPDGTNEYIPVDEDGTPLGVNKAKKKLPKTGGSDTTVYYAGGAILLILAAGVVVFRRKKYNR